MVTSIVPIQRVAHIQPLPSNPSSNPLQLTPFKLPESSEPASLENKSIVPIPSPHQNNSPMFKTWQIIVCAITVIGLLILLGLYYKYKSDRERQTTLQNQTPLPHLLPKIELPPLQALPGPEIEKMNLKKEEILKYYPQWRSIVKDWKGLTIEEELWMLQLFELRQLEIPIQIIDGLFGKDIKFLPKERSDLETVLKMKNAIEISLKAIQEIDTSLRVSRFPEAISWLPNLMSLRTMYPSDITLDNPPDLSKNLKLEILDICNEMSTPIDMSQLINLKKLHVYGYKTIPDFSNNINLTEITISDCLFEGTPDFSKNTKLQAFRMCQCASPIYLDFTHNLQLTMLNISFCPKIKISDLTNHSKLSSIYSIGLRLPQTEAQFLALRARKPPVSVSGSL